MKVPTVAQMRNLPDLTDVERDVIALRFDYDHLHTLTETSARLGLSREQIRKIELDLMRRHRAVEGGNER